MGIIERQTYNKINTKKAIERYTKRETSPKRANGNKKGHTKSKTAQIINFY